jgi:hypothetical protein
VNETAALGRPAVVQRLLRGVQDEAGMVRSDTPSHSAASDVLSRPRRSRSWISSNFISRNPCGTSVRLITASQPKLERF